MTADADLITAIRNRLAQVADAGLAAGMQAYMKSEMPYLGVRVPAVRQVVRDLDRHAPPNSTEALRETVLSLWRTAEFREERYAALALTNTRHARALRHPDLIIMYEEIISDGAWWDYADEVSHRVGELLVDYPGHIRPVLLRWQSAPNLWLRRSSIICQLGLRERTDIALLVGALTANAADGEFFIRKAIGWALREHAKHDPDWVRTFVATHELSPLSRREALKHLAARPADARQ